MMEFILAWTLISVDAHSRLTYSPPVKTLEDCLRVQKVVTENQYGGNRSQCVQVNILKRD